MCDKELYDKAINACDLSYAPYSTINVGAVALLEDQTIVCGANCENIASPACICAEQSLVGILNSLHHDKKIVAIAVAAKQNGSIINISPCGVCRQILSECEAKQMSDISVIFSYDGKLITSRSVNELLPFAFKK